MKRPAPVLTDVRHIKVCYSKHTYCGHPRQTGIFNYGNGELLLGHSHAPSRYQVPEDIGHSFTNGYASRARIIFQRSFDHGETWSAEEPAVVWDETLPLEEKRAILYQADEAAVAREQIDLTSPDAAVYFTRAATGPAHGSERDASNRLLECFAFRSADRGHTWETVPTRVAPPTGRSVVRRDAHPLVQCPDGTLLAVTIVDGSTPTSSVSIYGSDDHGLTWEYLAEVTRDPTGIGTPGYADILLLPSGRLQCYMLHGAHRNVIEMCHSDDGGYSWSERRPIVGWGHSPWAARRAPGSSRRGVYYRAPWPMRLRDGRIVVLFGRRKPPFGMGLTVSEDDGATWSAEAILRDDASGSDLSYPVATQLDDGRIFTAYYYMEADGNGFGGTRYIAGSFFRL